ncbi:CvpA family protein [Azospirillum sp. TSO22-1]|uniref:CvpA family protein n=1 Tax=Azospirillum sp. TSO22-1 TaxID=716789 RepID=UPI000D6148E1|nr:CvpA family protein [Azospirillum sp. TSO22-1]PWC52792.1 colicin V production protein [Azospirillum sp. TSO22-1]
MENFPINPADGVVFAVLLLSALLAFTRGMVAEVLSLAAWGGAALTALYTLPFVLPHTQKYLKVEMVAYVATSAALFIVALVVLTILFGRISRGVQNSSLSAVDRSLGFLFGLFKGAVLVSVAYLFFAWLIPAQEQPQWLQQAKTRPLMAAGAGMIYEFVPANLRAEGLNQADLARDRARQAIEAKEALDRLTSPVPAGGKTGAPPANTGYKERDRGEIDRLIQNTR